MPKATLPTPAELRAFSIEDLEYLAGDLRHRIVEASLQNGGHLGASLGTVEIAIALHREFQSPNEPIFWDVGHQAYAHKLLTGRADRFNTLRKWGGISGFLSRAESPHDVFGAGHSSTSLSAALAAAWVRGRTAKDSAPLWTCAVIGDGGLTAGLAFEALNNLRTPTLGPLLVILNDNQMSIAPNVGAITSILADGRAAEFFDFMGADYVGPIDGHDIETLLGTIEGIKRGWTGRPVILHAMTQKGRGYEPAESRPDYYHGIGPMQASGKVPAKAAGETAARSWSDVFGAAISDAARQDARVVAITAAMPEGTALAAFAVQYPGRCFDVGIAEAHAVTFAGGLAAQGMRPVVAIYSTFLQRAYDSIIHDVCLQALPVVFAIDRAGVVGADGPTHHGAFDISYLAPIPGIKLLSPTVASDMPMLLAQALGQEGPVAIRYPRGNARSDILPACEGNLRLHQSAREPEIIAIGLGVEALVLAQVAKDLDPEFKRITVVGVLQAKPIPTRLLTILAENPAARVLTLESGSAIGGFGALLHNALGGTSRELHVIGYPDRFLPHGSVAEIEAHENLNVASIKTRLQSMMLGK